MTSPNPPESASTRATTRSPRVAIVGGGPGGLMTAYLLQKSANRPLDVTVFEATERLGGKILTPTFRTAQVKYEAGAAEFYDYSPVDDDRLKELVVELELPISRMGGNSVALGGEILGHLDDVDRTCGPEVRRSLLRFHWAARSQLSPTEFFNLGGPEAPPRISTAARFDKFLDAIDDPLARTHVETLIHSDLATEPEQTSVDYGLQNYLMNDPAYMQLYGIDGGNEQLPLRLASRIVANFAMRRSVTEIGAGESGGVRVTSRTTAKPNSTTETDATPPLEIKAEVDITSDRDIRTEPRVTADEFDYVVLALPHDALPKIAFAGERLSAAMNRHIAHYDFPAHYLRITLLFERPFWGFDMVDSYCMLDQFDGCCLYDESSREAEPKYGVLGWLLGGEAARRRADRPDDMLIAEALDSLPPALQHGRSLLLEGRVHRWIGAVNAIPGGLAACPLELRHQPEPTEHPRLFVVGDYLFDSTLNGVLESAEFVAEWIATLVNDPARIEA